MNYTFKIARRLAASRVAPVAALVLAAACGGDPAAPSAPPADAAPGTPTADLPRSSAFVLTPSAASAEPNQSVQFAAYRLAANGDHVPVDVEWTASGGAIAATGSFSAPQPGTYRIIAKDRASAGLVDSATVNVTAPAAPSGAGAFPNLPGGMTRIIEHDFARGIDGASALTGVVSSPGGSYDFATAADAPMGGTRGVLQTHWNRGLSGGSSPGHFDGWDNANLYRTTKYHELYVSTRVKILGSDFENQLVGTKLWYVDYGNEAQQNDAYIMLSNGTGKQTLQRSMKVDVHISPCDDRDGTAERIMQNVDGRELFTVGQWHHVEVYLNAGTVDRKDGTVRVWIDGVKVTDRNDVQFLDHRNGFTNGFSWFQWTPVWGGNGGTRTRDDAMQLDHLLVAGKN